MCEHDNYHAEMELVRMRDEAGGPVTGWTLEVSIKCDDCQLPYRFLRPTNLENFDRLLCIPVKPDDSR